MHFARPRSRLFWLLASASLLLLVLTTTWYYATGPPSESVTLKAETALRTALIPSLVGGMRCANIAPQFADSIPPVVHWTSKDGRVPARLVQIVRSWQLLLNSSGSPGWHFMHWDDNQIGRLVATRYPQLVGSYAKLVNGLERSDIGRLAVLHHVGGVYVDLDVELRRDLSPWLQKPAAANTSGRFCTAVWSQEPLEHAVFSFNAARLISNAVIMSRANHSFLGYVLSNWPAWFQANWAAKTGRIHEDAVFVTGPMMLNAFYSRYASLPPSQRPSDWGGTELAEPDAFQPIWDEVYMPSRLRQTCSRTAVLTPQQLVHCRRLALTEFRTKPVPPDAFTVHRFLHLSYRKLDLTNSKHIADLLPILHCTLS